VIGGKNGSPKPTLFRHSAQGLHCRDVAPNILYGVDRSHNQRNRAPPPEQQVLDHKIAEMFADAALAQISFDLICAANEEHAYIPVKADACSLAHASTTLTTHHVL